MCVRYFFHISFYTLIIAFRFLYRSHFVLPIIMTKQNLVIFGNICTQKYYHDAIRIITEKVNDAVFYVFSDDISWVQTHLDIPNAVYVNWNTGESSIYDMYLMSSCKYNIIANSTFSYWAARLNKKTNMVIYPSKWYNTFTPDIFPESWCGI